MTIHVNNSHLEYLTPETEEVGFLEDSSMDKEFDSMWQLEIDAKKGMTHGVGQDSPVIPSSEGASVSSLMTSEGCLSSKSSSGDGDSSSTMHNGLVKGKDSAKVDSTSMQNSTLKIRSYQCPLCNYCHSDPNRLQQHVNELHFNDDPLPSTSKETDFICPICNKTSISGQELEAHVNSDHKDLLKSPDTIGAPTDVCPVCFITGFKNHNQFVEHVDHHFSSPRREADDTVNLIQLDQDYLLAQELDKKEKEDRKYLEIQEFAQLQAQFGMDNEGNYREQSISNMQKAVCKGELSVVDFYERQTDLKMLEMNGIDDGHSVTRNPIPKLRSFVSQASGSTQVYLCSVIDHHATSFGDKGWGCGYRNLQMLLSSLRNQAIFLQKLNARTEGSPVLGTDGSIPSIMKLQNLIEEAWMFGYDTQGRDQLGGQLINTKKWIGATEIVAMLTSKQIKVELLDFHTPTAKDGTHPRLFQWVLAYFRERHHASQFVPPLYFQHQGHSRTIIGIEVASPTNMRLFVLDPSHSKAQMAGLLKKENCQTALRMLRKTPATIKSLQYQIVAVTGVYDTALEAKAHKIIRSTRIP